MKTVTIRDFRTRPRAVQEALSRKEDAVLTANGKPVAIMVPVTAETFDSAIDLLRRMRAIQALGEIRRRAAQNGTDKLTMAEIDDIIDETRKERRVRAKRTGRA